MGKIGENDKGVEPIGSEIKFTVIVCTFNYGHLLPDALRTLAAQTVPDFEVLIADDGSTDNTEEIVRHYSPKFQNCVYLKKAHSGLAHTRNVAVREAKGTHLAFLDADDFWSPHYLEAVRSRLESTPQAELVFCNGLKILANGIVLRPVFLPTLPSLEGTFPSTRNPFPLCTDFFPSGMVFRKSLYQRIGGFDTRFDQGLGDDVDWVVRALVAGAHCACIDRKLFLNRFHGGNLTSNAVGFLGPWLTIYSEHLKGSPLGWEFDRSARHFTREYLIRLLVAASPSDGRALLGQTLKTFPGDVILLAAYLSTYMGSTYALKALRWGKRLMPHRLRGRRRLDLSMPPEMIFARV